MIENILLGIVALMGIFVVLYFADKMRIALNNLPHIDNSDPTRMCKMYVEQGCSHIDGMQCNIKTCTMLRDYNSENGNH